jgi:hypothetical protein
VDQLEALAAQIQTVSDRAAAVAARVGADRIATRAVANKQIEREGKLIELALAQAR